MAGPPVWKWVWGVGVGLEMALQQVHEGIEGLLGRGFMSQCFPVLGRIIRGLKLVWSGLGGMGLRRAQPLGWGE